jgi:dienelactone hydrolase
LNHQERLTLEREHEAVSIPRFRSPGSKGWRMSIALGVLLLFALIVGNGVPSHVASADEALREEAVSFESGGITLHGRVLVPNEASSPGRKPAVVLVHGAGPHTREDQRDEAEAFAREGIVTLIYDKRTEGYSQIERSYKLLADDALAAVDALREHPEVDPDAVGLWGLSEGAWVVPIAASRPEGQKTVDFVVLVAASGVPPARQHSWNLENNIRHQGVLGSMVEAISRTGTRLLVGAGVFAEADHDPVGPLERVRQPVLALWGEKDRIQPPAESARIVREALARGGNDKYAIRFFPDAEHGLRSSPDGFTVREQFASGYARTVASWVKGVERGEAPGPSIAGTIPEQARSSRPLDPLAWWESAWVQLGAMGVPALAFASYPATAFVLWLRRPMPRRASGQPKRRARWCAYCLAFAGLAAILGFVVYFGFLMFTAASAVGPVVAGRAIPWLVLQALAVAACVSTVLLAAAWRPSIRKSTRVERTRIGVVLVGGVVFVVWTAYWGLLYP